MRVRLMTTISALTLGLTMAGVAMATDTTGGTTEPCCGDSYDNVGNTNTHDESNDNSFNRSVTRTSNTTENRTTNTTNNDNVGNETNVTESSFNGGNTNDQSNSSTNVSNSNNTSSSTDSRQDNDGNGDNRDNTVTNTDKSIDSSFNRSVTRTSNRTDARQDNDGNGDNRDNRFDQRQDNDYNGDNRDNTYTTVVNDHRVDRSVNYRGSVVLSQQELSGTVSNVAFNADAAKNNQFSGNVGSGPISNDGGAYSNFSGIQTASNNTGLGSVNQAATSVAAHVSFRDSGGGQ